MEANEHETESKLVASHLVYVAQALKLKPDASLVKIAKDYYGAPDRVHELTERLCTACQMMTKAQQDRIIYDGRSQDARSLATWWEAHQEADRQKAADAARVATRTTIKAQALAKLTPKERRALGL